MPLHVDRTANIQRTREEYQCIGYSLAEIDTVIDGYPDLDQRFYWPLNRQLPFRESRLLGREVSIYSLPSGHDATGSSLRQAALDSTTAAERLYGEADPDLPTGGDWKLPEDHPTIKRAIDDRCRDFTQHLQPLVPGWRELLALKSPDGQPLGMPTGIGWYTNYWLSRMCDGVTMRLSEDGDDIDVLLYQRPGDNQSEPVWATPGGYVMAADAVRSGATPLQAASARRTWDRTGRDVMSYSGVPLQVKYPISSGNTLVAGLATEPFARFIPAPDYKEDPSITVERQAKIIEVAGFVSMRALCESNATGGVSGKGHAENPFPIWTTHFEYVAAGLLALKNPENQFYFGMSDRQFAQISATVNDLRRTYDTLAEA